MTIAEQIRVLCARKNISQAELARLTNRSPQSLNSKIKRESFTIEELEELATAVGAVFEHNFILENGERI